MPPQNPFLRSLHSAARKVPPLVKTYRKLKAFSRSDPLVTAAYRKVFERRRLTLPLIDPEKLSPAADAILLPSCYPLFANEDAFLNDLLFLLNLAKGRQAKRILEVGTYRARTTLALHLNCPQAFIASYDVQVLASPYREALQAEPGVELRHASFSASANPLRAEAPYDFIFVDGSHRLEDVKEDSRLALELIAAGGVIVWHDYRHNDYFNKEMKVPEALTVLSREYPLHVVRGTMCAVYERQSPGKT